MTPVTRRLVIYGDLSVDICLRTGTFPAPGQDARVEELDMLPGGSAANCAVAAARLGVAVVFVGLTGCDTLSDMLVDDLRTNGVDVTHLRRVEGAPGVVVAVTGAEGDRTFFSYRGANSRAAYGPLPPDLPGAGDVLHLSGYSFQEEPSRVTALALLAQAEKRGARITLDPSFLFASDPAARGILSALDVLFPNQEEALLLSGKPTPQAAAAALRETGVGTVVVKLGSEGCYLEAAGTQEFIPAYPVARVVDTIGAGDAFCSGFLAGMLWGLDLTQAARIGQAAAASVIEQPGGHQGAPTREALIERIAQAGDVALAAMLRQLQHR